MPKKGYKQTEEHKQKEKEHSPKYWLGKKRPSPSKISNKKNSEANKKIKHTKKWNKNVSLAKTGKKRMPFSNEWKRKMRENHIKYVTSGKVKNKDTSIEIAIENELKRKNIYYEKQVPLCKVCIADFYLPQYRIVIFCDGTYWHSREINQGRDIAQDTVLTFNGFNVYRFTEVEIKKSVKKCIRDIYLAVRKEK